MQNNGIFKTMKTQWNIAPCYAKIMQMSYTVLWATFKYSIKRPDNKQCDAIFCSYLGYRRSRLFAEFCQISRLITTLELDG